MVVVNSGPGRASLPAALICASTLMTTGKIAVECRFVKVRLRVFDRNFKRGVADGEPDSAVTQQNQRMHRTGLRCPALP